MMNVGRHVRAPSEGASTLNFNAAPSLSPVDHATLINSCERTSNIRVCANVWHWRNNVGNINPMARIEMFQGLSVPVSKMAVNAAPTPKISPKKHINMIAVVFGSALWVINDVTWDGSIRAASRQKPRPSAMPIVACPARRMASDAARGDFVRVGIGAR
jgi:hypothetical protein